MKSVMLNVQKRGNGPTFPDPMHLGEARGGEGMMENGGKERGEGKELS